MCENCAICCGDLTGTLHILNCLHSFHLECYESLRKNNFNECPLCRKSIDVCPQSKTLNEETAKKTEGTQTQLYYCFLFVILVFFILLVNRKTREMFIDFSYFLLVGFLGGIFNFE